MKNRKDRLAADKDRPEIIINEDGTVELPPETDDEQGNPALTKFLAWFGLGITIVICTGVGIMIMQMGLLDSVETIRGWVEKLGVFGPVVLVLAQVAQVILRFVPGGVTCAATVLIYGPAWGFVLNYLGLLIGCVAVYWLVQRFGINMAIKLAGRKNLEKYWKWTSGKKFEWVFLITAALPAFPDDIICVAASLARVPFKKYFIICAIGRSFGLILYSLAGAGLLGPYGASLLG